MFMELPLNMEVTVSEGIWPLPAVFTLSIILADLYPDKTIDAFSLSGVYREFGAKIMEIKVMEIDALLN